MHFLPTPTVKEMTNLHRQSTELLVRPQCLSLCVSLSFCLSCFSVSVSLPPPPFILTTTVNFSLWEPAFITLPGYSRKAFPLAGTLALWWTNQQNYQVCLRWCLPILHPQKGWCGGTKMARVVRAS